MKRLFTLFLSLACCYVYAGNLTCNLNDVLVKAAGKKAAAVKVAKICPKSAQENCDNGITQEKVDELMGWFEKGNKYAYDKYRLGINPVKVINLGENGKGNYASQDEWFFSNAEPKVILSKVFQGLASSNCATESNGKFSISKCNSSIGYTGVEAFGNYFLEEFVRTQTDLEKADYNKNGFEKNIQYVEEWQNLNAKDYGETFGKTDQKEIEATRCKVRNNNVVITKMFNEVEKVLKKEGGEDYYRCFFVQLLLLTSSEQNVGITQIANNMEKLISNYHGRYKDTSQVLEEIKSIVAKYSQSGEIKSCK